MTIRAIYFDLDDTLCAYWQASKRALRETFEGCATQDCSAEKLLADWDCAFQSLLPEIKTERWYPLYLKSGELTRTEQMRRTLRLAGREEERLASELSQKYMDLRNRYLELFPEALSVLQALHGTYPLGVITNGPADIQRMELDALGICGYFDHVFIEGEQGLGKPQAEIFRRAEAAVGLGPEDLLFVGNSYKHDVLPALEAGWHAVWINRRNEFAPSAEVETIPPGIRTPDAAIGTLDELIPLLFNEVSNSSETLRRLGK